MLYLCIAIAINLQLACVQAANGGAGIEHVYVTLTTLWKFFYYSPKCTQSLKKVQKVLDFPELKIVKPSNTRWLAHERCVRAVKESHEPEALGIKKSSLHEINNCSYLSARVCSPTNRKA